MESYVAILPKEYDEEDVAYFAEEVMNELAKEGRVFTNTEFIERLDKGNTDRRTQSRNRLS